MAFDDPFGLKCAGRGNCTQSDGGVVAAGEAAEKAQMEHEAAEVASVLMGALEVAHDLYYSCGGLPCITPVGVSPVEPMGTPEISTPYSRPAGATTPAQRASVQGQPCAVCGVTAERMFAGHKQALVVEYYTTGTIDMQRARSLDAVQAECPGCSGRGGSRLSIYSRYQRLLNGLGGGGAGRSF